MVRVKVCGIHSLAEAHWAIEAGADALGFIFVKSSKRYVKPQTVKEISLNLPPFTGRVGVFADSSPSEVEQIARICHLTAIQLHGSEKIEDYEPIALPIIKAVKETETHSEEIKEEWLGKVQGILIDSVLAGQFGGTGKTVAWGDRTNQQFFATIKKSRIALILAGGLTPQNVREALRLVSPYAVDVSSGVEVNGVKNKELIREFVYNAKSTAL